MDNNTAKKEKKVKKANKKPNFFSRLGGKIKEIFSELKKVTWPSFKTVLKQLGCVLALVMIFLVVILVIDLGLYELLKLIQGGASASAVIGAIL